MNIIGERLKYLRKEKGMTQDELAKMSYVSRKVISDIEREITKTVKITVMGLLAYNLGVTEDYLTKKSENRDRTENGEIPLIVRPEWDYKYEIRQLLKNQKDNEVEKLMIKITSFMMDKEKNSIGFEILRTIIDTIKNNDSEKDLMLLLDIIKVFDKKEKDATEEINKE